MKAPPRHLIETPTGRIAYLRAGAGPTVVLVHGSLTTADDMALALFDMLSRDHDVIAFDRPGHGGSDPLPGDQGSPRAQAAAILDAWQRLDVQLPTVVGHSFGGAVVLALAHEWPDEVAGIVALAPICFPEVRLEQMVLGPRALPYVGEMIATSFGRIVDVALLPVMRNAMFLPQIMPDAYRDAFPTAWASTALAMMADARDGLSELKELAWMGSAYAACRCRVAILGGTHDLVVANARHGLVAASLMPTASYHWVSGMGHMLHHFEQGLVAKAVHEVSTQS